MRDDAVSYHGSSFIALREVTGVTPAVGADWDLLAAGTDQLLEEGDILIHDGNTPVRLARGTDKDEALQAEGHMFRLLEINHVDALEGEMMRDDNGVVTLKLGNSPLSTKMASIDVTTDF